jgi:hypothetical protein
MAHKNGLDGVYLTPTREQCFAEFKKAIPSLTISDEERLRFENNKKQQKIENIDKKNLQLQDLSKRIDDLENGPEARWGGFFKESYKVKDETWPRTMLTIFQMWFEMRTSEEEKRIIWKKLQEAKRNGKTLDVLEFGESQGLKWDNMYSTN